MPNQRRYAARATTWGLGEASTGNEQVAVEFEILTPDAEVNRLTWFGTFTEKAFEHTMKALRNCGWAGDDLTDLSGLDANEVELVVEDEEYQGNWSPRIKWVNKPGGLALKAPLVGDRAKAFAARMRDQIRAHDAGSGTPKPKPAPSTRPKPATRGNPPDDGYQPPMDDKDLPF